MTTGSRIEGVDLQTLTIHLVCGGVCDRSIEPRKNVELLSWPILRDERWVRLHPGRGA